MSDMIIAVRARYALRKCLLNDFFFSSRRRHTRCSRDWSSDVCSSDLNLNPGFSNDPTSGVTAGCTFGKTTIPAGIPLGTPDRYYDPCAFSLPAAGTYGNLGRNTLTGPGLSNVDVSLDKVFKPTERMNVQFRAEVFNIFNRTNFYAPGWNVFSGT